MHILEKRRKLYQRKRRVRAKVRGTKSVPRLAVYRSLKHIYAQLIDDENGKTIVSASDRDLDQKGQRKEKGKISPRLASAFAVGKLIAERALGKKIRAVVFDRGGRIYHGRVRSVAEGARAGGLKF